MTNIGVGEGKFLGIRRKIRKNPEKVAQKKKKYAGIRKNPLDNGGGIVYNNMAHFNNEVFDAVGQTITYGGKTNEKNISAQEDSETEGARLPQKNENRERKKGSREKTREGQKKTQLLSMGEFSKAYLTIKKDREFRFLFGKGQSCVNYAFVCYFRENRRRRNRCGIVTGKKIGNAVTRNRARRVLREAFRLFDHKLTGLTEKRFDFVFVARGQTAALKSQKILRLMETRLLPMLAPGEKN